MTINPSTTVGLKLVAIQVRVLMSTSAEMCGAGLVRFAVY